MLTNQDFSVDRSKYIGGSDIGAILGLSPYRTALEVWREKTGKNMDTADSLALRFGSYAEAFVASEYARATGFTLTHDQSTYVHPTHSYMSAHIDRFVLENSANKLPTRLLECKTANPFAKGQWGEAGTDQIPMSYLCQCAWYMAITGVTKTDLAVLFGNHDFRIYEVNHDSQLESLILEKATHFWQEYVLKDIPPPAQNERDCQALFHRGDSQKVVQANLATLENCKRLYELNAEIAIKEAKISALKQSLMSHMGEAETLSYQEQVLATWKAPKPSFRIDSKRLEQEQPAIYAQYKSPVQNSRRLTIKDIALSIS